MKELVILIRPKNLEKVKKILDDINCGGMTLSTAMGCGTQKGIAADEEETVNEIRGLKTTINLLPKVKVEVVVEDKDVEPIIEKLRETCVTGHVGDGKIFVRRDWGETESPYAMRRLYLSEARRLLTRPIF